MANWLQVVLAVVIGLSALQFQAILAEGEDEDEDKKVYYPVDLSYAWIEKPPYTTSPTNESLNNEFHGMIRDALYRYISWDCGYAIHIAYQRKYFLADSEFGMIELLRQNKVHVAVPIFEPINRKYSEFVFFKLADYPGTDFITTEKETNRLNAVLEAVMKSWPLFAVTLILTAIAGVILWALVG